LEIAGAEGDDHNITGKDAMFLKTSSGLSKNTIVNNKLVLMAD
jgi:hypothetical protein